LKKKRRAAEKEIKKAEKEIKKAEEKRMAAEQKRAEDERKTRETQQKLKREEEENQQKLKKEEEKTIKDLQSQINKTDVVKKAEEHYANTLNNLSRATVEEVKKILEHVEAYAEREDLYFVDAKELKRELNDYMSSPTSSSGSVGFQDARDEYQAPHPTPASHQEAPPQSSIHSVRNQEAFVPPPPPSARNHLYPPLHIPTSRTQIFASKAPSAVKEQTKPTAVKEQPAKPTDININPILDDILENLNNNKIPTPEPNYKAHVEKLSSEYNKYNSPTPNEKSDDEKLKKEYYKAVEQLNIAKSKVAQEEGVFAKVEEIKTSTEKYETNVKELFRQDAPLNTARTRSRQKSNTSRKQTRRKRKAHKVEMDVKHRSQYIIKKKYTGYIEYQKLKRKFFEKIQTTMGITTGNITRVDIYPISRSSANASGDMEVEDSNSQQLILQKSLSNNSTSSMDTTHTNREKSTSSNQFVPRSSSANSEDDMVISSLSNNDAYPMEVENTNNPELTLY
jgi:hypothetical protein